MAISSGTVQGQTFSSFGFAQEGKIFLGQQGLFYFAPAYPLSLLSSSASYNLAYIDFPSLKTQWYKSFEYLYRQENYQKTFIEIQTSDGQDVFIAGSTDSSFLFDRRVPWFKKRFIACFDVKGQLKWMKFFPGSSWYSSKICFPDNDLLLLERNDKSFALQYLDKKTGNKKKANSFKVFSSLDIQKSKYLLVNDEIIHVVQGVKKDREDLPILHIRSYSLKGEERWFKEIYLSLDPLFKGLDSPYYLDSLFCHKKEDQYFLAGTFRCFGYRTEFRSFHFSLGSKGEMRWKETYERDENTTIEAFILESNTLYLTGRKQKTSTESNPPENALNDAEIYVKALSTDGELLWNIPVSEFSRTPFTLKPWPYDYITFNMFLFFQDNQLMLFHTKIQEDDYPQNTLTLIQSDGSILKEMTFPKSLKNSHDSFSSVNSNDKVPYINKICDVQINNNTLYILSLTNDTKLQLLNPGQYEIISPVKLIPGSHYFHLLTVIELD